MRHLPPGNKWFSATDKLLGTEEYGDPSGGAQARQEWTVRFDTTPFDQFLFSTGDCYKWLVATKAAVIGQYYSGIKRDILKSSKSDKPYKAQWYHRSGNREDPWISLSDHSPASAAGEIIYGGNKGGSHNKILPRGMGVNVYIRHTTAGDVYICNCV